MKDLHRLMTEITQLTSNIESNYPEVYRLLDENTLTIPGPAHPAIDKKTLEDYLQTLKELLKHQIKEQHVKRVTRVLKTLPHGNNSARKSDS
ncbi:MAG TPA: hypothetical protein VFO54_00730 [Chryseosolibacter sp.]|nr:hypothetical protein [Chryseosolibacter sp.]